MSDYFYEMGWQPLGPSEAPNQLLHLARLLRDYNVFHELGGGHRLAPPASKQITEHLPEHEITSDDMKCPICLKLHAIGTKAKQLPCKHLYHSECIIPWLTRTNSCPVCRHELPTDDPDYEAYRKEKIRAKQRAEDIEALHNSMFS